MGKYNHINLITKEIDGELKTFKACSVCGEIKELNDYYKSKNGLGGHAAKCKQCVSSFFKKYNKTDETKNKVFEQGGRLLKKCQKCEEVKDVSEFYTHGTSYVAKCKPCYLQERRKGTGPKPINILNINGVESKECRICGEIKSLDEFSVDGNGRGIGGRLYACKDCMRVKWKGYREANRDNTIVRSRKWRLSNPEKQLLAQRRWRISNKEKDIIYRNRRRALKAHLRDDLTSAQWEEILDYFNHVCALSNEGKDVTMDHFIPVSTGKGGTYVGNVYPLSSKLNNSKHNRNPFDWFEKYGTLHNIEEQAWNRLVSYLAKANGMTLESFKEYVDVQFKDVNKNVR